MFLCGVFVAPLSTCVFLFIVIACYCYYCHQSYLFCCFWDMFSIMVRISSSYQHNHHSLFYHFWLNTQTECVLNVLQRFLIVTMFMFKTKNTYPYNYSQIAETSESWTISWLGGSVGQYIYIYISFPTRKIYPKTMAYRYLSATRPNSSDNWLSSWWSKAYVLQMMVMTVIVLSTISAVAWRKLDVGLESVVKSQHFGRTFFFYNLHPGRLPWNIVMEA